MVCAGREAPIKNLPHEKGAAERSAASHGDELSEVAEIKKEGFGEPWFPIIANAPQENKNK